MLLIRDAQMKIFEQSARGQFVTLLTAQLAQETPHLAGPGFREEISSMVERAIGYGFRDKGHIATWVRLECRYGPHFERKPEFAVVKEILDLELGAATKLYKIDRRLNPPREDE